MKINKLTLTLSSAVAVVLSVCTVLTVFLTSTSTNGTVSTASDGELTAAKPNDTESSSTVEDNNSDIGSSAEETDSSDGNISTDSSASSNTVDVPIHTKPAVSTPEEPEERPIENVLFPGYKYNAELDIDNNVFLDALAYTGYNLEKHRNDGLMWNYILSNDKKHRGWLSNITYGAGCTGLETTSDGLPSIKKFERTGLVCAGFASYVYFNYLPNVAHIDTSSLDIPENPASAQSFYLTAQKWLSKGYTYTIDFTAKNKTAGIEFTPEEEIPIGSILVFRDFDKPNKKEADHITIYVGEKNGYHWVIQVGNKNGPEFCAVERFKFGPHPQWPIKVFATPTCIYDAIGAKAAADENT